MILGIESSCDDLSMALVHQGKVISVATASQTKDHAPYGGVVPEIASRRHLDTLEATLDLTLSQANISLQELDGIAATYAPGLVGSLLVGLNFAKAMAFALNKPFRGIHHIEAHLWSPHLEHELKLPFLGLIVSGGHSHLYFVKEFGNYQLMGKTVDDAAGEAFDKVAKMMGLPYPGGPAIDRLSEQGNPQSFDFALPRVKNNPLNTSFSGMKTAALDYYEKENIARADLAASFQASVVKALKVMVERALKQVQVKQLIMAGGVACNRSLRTTITQLAQKHQLALAIPSPKYCTDNGAMVAWVGEQYLDKMESSPLTLNARARKSL